MVDYRGYDTKARSLVAKAVRDGSLVRLDGSVKCSDCENTASEYDHRNYLRPLDVDPVCKRCNRRRGASKPIPESFPSLVNGPKQKISTRLEKRFIYACKPYPFSKTWLAKEVARVTKRPCSRQTVWNWCKWDYVPEDSIRAVHRITGIPVRFLRKPV